MEIRKWIGRAVSFAVVLTGVSIFYYYVVFLPKPERVKLDLQRQAQQQEEEDRAQKEQQQREANAALGNCLLAASKDYDSGWAQSCEAINGVDSDRNCSLPTTIADRLNQLDSSARDECFRIKMYPK